LPLLRHFLETASTLEGRPVPAVSADALAYLEQYCWPGNVRELKNVAERLVIGFGGTSITRSDLRLESGAAATIPNPATSPDPWHRLIDEAFDRMTIRGESFWTAVYEPFIKRDLTREALRAIVRRGLEHTSGSYPLVASMLNVADQDYRKFMRVLHKHDCHIGVQAFRVLRHADEAAATTKVGYGGTVAGISRPTTPALIATAT
jgi:DNA-binding NtrC family response regulator